MAVAITVNINLTIIAKKTPSKYTVMIIPQHLERYKVNSTEIINFW